MELNEIKKGFKVTRIVELKEIKATFYELVHEKSKMPLYWLKRDDVNKTFAMAFKTIPSDDTGVFHIIEHSVLSGSKKYPLKEPFLDLLKGSLNTFLNAMTYPDKTVYPVSSKNNADFLNLAKVYLDAVFAPSIYDKKEIFYQEGWHYEFDDEDNVSYKGVVFNEMKGAMADIDDAESEALTKALFEGTCYEYNSGGDPKSIPDLSYEKFIETHKKYYSPQNAYCLLDGDINIDDILDLFEEYLNVEGGNSINYNFFSTDSIKEDVVVPYEIGKSEDEDKGRLVYGHVIGKFDDPLKQYASYILSDVLCGYNEAPLKKAILDSGLAEDISMSLYDGIAEPFIKTEVKNVKLEDINKVKELINKTLNDLYNNGLDHEQIRATLENYEFTLKEKDYGTLPLGLVYIITMLESALYGGDPLLKLEIDEYFKDIRNKIDENYFEDLLRGIFLDNKHYTSIIMKPDKTLGSKRQEIENQRINSEVSKWSDAERSNYKKAALDTSAWQSSEDSKEVKEMLPRITVDDINKEAEVIDTKIIKKDDITLLKHELSTNGIYYVTMYFDLRSLGIEDYSKLTLFATLFGKLKTSKHSASELTRLLSLYTGNFSISTTPYSKYDDIKTVVPKLLVSFSCLKDNFSKAKELVIEVIKDTVINEETKDDIETILNQLVISANRALSLRARNIANDRVLGKFSPIGVINDTLSGYNLYLFLKKVQSDKSLDTLIDDLNKMKSLFNRNELVVSVTADEVSDSDIDDLVSQLDYHEFDEAKEIKLFDKVNEAIIIPSDVSYGVLGNDLSDYQKYSGEALVAMKILTFSYLWVEIRQKGGSYGCGSSFLTTNYMSSNSYRDPSPNRSIEIFKRQGDFLKEFSGDVKESIIGTIADEDILMTSRIKAIVADRNYFIGYDTDKQKAIRKAIISTDERAIKDVGEALNKAMSEALYCVIGNREAINKLDDVDIVYTV